MSLTVRIVAPIGRDAELIAATLTGNGLAAVACSAEDLSLDTAGPPMGPVLIAEEALRPDFLKRFAAFLENQPAWSDLPVLLMSGGRGREHRAALGSPVLLERPLRQDTLLSSVRAAVRARTRQYQVRDVLQERDAALAEMERGVSRFRMVLDRATVGISVGDTDGKLMYTNPALLAMLGYDDTDIPEFGLQTSAQPLHRLATTPHPERDRHAQQQLSERGRATPYENLFHARDGSLVPLLVGATMLPRVQDDTASTDIATFFTDLSGQKRAESALLRSEKLAAVGKLASSISHEINNPLEAITNLLYIVKADDTLNPETRGYLEAAERELMRVSQVASNTLRFHRQSTSATSIRPETLLEEVLALHTAKLTNANVGVSKCYAPDVRITCYEGDIRQVLANLVGNATDAMKQGGRLLVRTRYAINGATGAPGVRFTVADTGEGVTPELRQRIFEAFFTTKGIHGTGLGLWISSRIVSKHGGALRMWSRQRKPGARVGKPPHGTVFTLWLPLQLASTARDPWNDD